MRCEVIESALPMAGDSMTLNPVAVLSDASA